MKAKFYWNVVVLGLLMVVGANLTAAYADVPLADDSTSAEFKKVRTEFLSISTSAGLNNFLAVKEKAYKTSAIRENDTKFFLLNLLAIQDFRGILWKLRPLAAEAKASHAVMISAIQAASGFQTMFLNTAQWKAGFDFLTQPAQPSDVQFTDERALLRPNAKSGVEKFQDFLVTVEETTKRSLERLEALDFSNGIVVDSQLFYGTASFQSDLADRFFIVGQPEKAALLSAYHIAIHNINVFRAYQFPDFIKVFAEYGKKFGVQAVSFSGASGFTAQERATILRDHPKNGVLIKQGKAELGQDRMKVALSHLVKASELANDAWNGPESNRWQGVKNRPASQYNPLDNALFASYQVSRATSLSLKNFFDLTHGPAKISSVISPDKVAINLPAFYNHAPKSLNSLLPTHFEGENSKSTGEIVKWGLAPYRDYQLGRPSTWNLTVWSTVFTGAATQEDLKEGLRLLSQSWGGGAGLIPALFLVI